eukprot:CCRYP_005783-RA/>CCRYP_005783-RA protein AED:0.00 eAED:0.00 QI:831/1/1/1/1/1/3/2372/6166
MIIKLVPSFLTLSLALGHDDHFSDYQSASVPGPPEWATLKVLGSNTLQTTFAPPLWDGGSPITSYLVEWDKEAGIPEVQRIVTSQNLNTNEVQTITTSAPDINEIQVIRTSATALAEVQAITVSPPTGDASVNSAYSFALSLDTIDTGGSLQYSGQISANAEADGSRSSVAEMIENMANVHGRPSVERTSMNPDGGHTYLVTFPISMGNVPEMTVLMSDLPVSVSTVQHGNQLEGSFRLEFMGELTADIAFDASSFEMQRCLEDLDKIGAVSVARSKADEQGGFSWEIEFVSDTNAGNVESIVVHGDGLRTSNPIGGAYIEHSGGRDGSYISGSFTLSFRGQTTNPISFDADSSTVKEELEALSTIARVAVERSSLDIVGGCTWTISFLEDESRLHRGDMPLLQVESSLIGSPGQIPSIEVAEQRKGTKKEVQTISIDGGGGFVDPTSMFKLRFGDEVTGDIPALPIDGSTCLGSTKAKQIITTSSVDTSGVGGDDSVSHLTSFALTYDGYTTSKIMANTDSCEVTSQTIARELMRLPPLYEVAVSGTDTGAGDEGCSWTVTFLSAMGNPELMTVTAFNSGKSAGPGYSVTVGDHYSIIRDTVLITQPDEFKGDVNLIQSELSKLSSIGVVTVTPLSPVPDSFGQCVWRVTFESKAGDVPSIEVAKSGTDMFSTVADLNSGNKVTVTDDTVQGTSLPVSGDFRLEFDGEVTGYMPFDASHEELKAALDALSNIGHVVVTREGPDVNRCYTWDVTFVSDLGPLPLLVADDLDLKGTVVSISVSKAVVGVLPPFNGPDYGSQVITNTTDTSLVISPLKQGVAHYVRISAHSQMGAGPSIMPYPPFQVPLPQPPSYPSDVELESVDGSTLAVSIHAPFHDGGEEVVTYRVDYSTKPFSHERQRISLACTPQPEIQSITTSAADINEIQFLVIDSSYFGNGEVLEVQRVLCDATGGTFGLSLGGETAYISHDDDADGIKQALESLSIIYEVSVNFNAGGSMACAPHDGINAGDFSITFQSLTGVSGDLPIMLAETSGLDGARRVEVVPVIDGDAPLTGSLKLSFRGAMTESVDVSMDSSDIADMIDTVLEALDTVQRDGVVVTPVTLEHGGFEKIFRIEFQGDGVGGNVEPLVIVPEFLLVKGSSADAFILSDGESYAARNGFDSFFSRAGNELSGHFRLKLRGHTTGRISFNSSVDQLKARLEELPNVGEVDVQMSGPSKEMAYSWFVTFLSNPGFFPPATRDVELLEAISELSTSVETDSSAKIVVESIQKGDDRLTGEFLVSFNDGKTTETTRPLQSFISANDLKMEFEALANVGRVNVVRSQSLTGYEWDIEFTSCALKNGLEVCNDGDLLDISAVNVNLRGCGGPTLAVVEIKAGSGPDACPDKPNGYCSDEIAFDGEYPIFHHIRGLSLGVPYYVQARLRNSQSYGYRRLSNPPQGTPKHNPPGPPPPVVLKESSSSSITVGWTKPKNYGGKAVSGYELWMDSWSGGDTFMVYDGAGNPDILEYHLTTDDAGPHSQVVETGRQYRFQVRAINNCDTDDPDRACYGEFSEVQIFTVRDPRPPLPPSIPRRDSRTRIISSSEASISISWSPPVDNGGSAITGYIVYMRDPDGTVTSHALGSETTMWQEDGLHPGEVYRFHVAAINAMGKSGNSPVLSTLAAVTPGFNYVGQVRYSDFGYRPLITDVHETSLTVKWSNVPADISGGSPITGFKLYMYKDVTALPYDADPIHEEVQYITISSKSIVTGTFTLSFRGYETADISVDATSNAVKMALQNLPTINFVNVESLYNGWSITFLSEAGDLPLMEATSGRLMGDPSAKVEVAEATKGDPADLIYDGSETPSVLSFEASDLVTDLGYAFKVAPVNSIGDGILSAASTVAVARSGASASRTTASGSALFSGIAGSIREVQIVTFLSNDCDADKLILSFGFSEQTGNLCGATDLEFQLAVSRIPGVGDVHVSREELSISGHVGYSWTVTFTSRTGDVPLLSVDLSQVGNGKDSFGNSGSNSFYVVEFLKGRANEFTIEPKKASGKVVKDLTTHDAMSGGDIFFTELWTSDPSIVDGSHVWYSDGGVSSYNRLLHEEQVIAIPESVGPFFLAMDTSEFQQGGRIDGLYSKTKTFLQAKDVTDISLQQALSELRNVLGKVDVTRINEDHESIAYFVVTFKDTYGEMPLISASDPYITVSRNGGQYSATEIQSITVSADKPFIYEVQSIIIPSSCSTFDLSFMSDSKTNSISCNFADISEASIAVSTLQDELNNLSNVKVHVDTRVSGSGEADNPWQFKVTFIEPVGPLPLLNSGDVEISQVVQGESTLSGSFVISYEGKYSADIPFDATARDVKNKLESLDTITEVNVKRVDKYTGYQWAVSFTGNAGNLPPMIAHNNVFEIQSIEIVGGQPTPLGGTFTLSYLSETTSPLLHDSSAEMVKSSLEALRSINHVDVSHEVSKHGQSRWLVTFRSPTNPAQLAIESTQISGTLENAAVAVLVASKNPSLTAKSGSAPLIVIEEKIAGRPSYTGRYFAKKSGSYTLAVMQLESGGLNARYYDNQWLLEEPVIERVDPTISFNWGSGIITQYGRDFISVRWWGKILPSTSELYTFYLLADDGVRLYVDHNLLIDLWDEHSVEKRATFPLTSDSFHDLKIEYKEITGEANIQLQWSSPSTKKQIIPPSQLYYTSHIVGSPFLTNVSPGAADYPYSGFIEVPGEDRSAAIAGERTSFYLQARDSSGNKKLTNGDAQGDVQTPEEQFTVEITGTHGSMSGDVTYMSSGQYRVDFIVLKAGTYQVHVKTGGTDIYCGLGEEQKCSPFTLTVLPGATLPSNCEAESSFNPVDNLVEARAGDTGKIYVQAKDAFGNNRRTGGDEIVAKFKSLAHPEIQYRAHILDRGDGSYVISYSIPLAGHYLVSIQVNGEPVKYCIGPSGERWDSRHYDGKRVYSSPSFCSLNEKLTLSVIHRDIHGLSSTLANEPGSSGLSHAIVGVETSFVVESRDKFGNLRSGSSTTNIPESGDGMSDAFLVTLVSPTGHTTITSSAIQTLSCSDSSVYGYFRLSYGGRVSSDIPHDISGPAMQVILSAMHWQHSHDPIEVDRDDEAGKYRWKITFKDHLDLWSSDPLAVLPGSDDFSAVSDVMVVTKDASSGVYPIRYKLWEKGTYELTVFSGATLVSGSSFSVEVTNGVPQASSSFAYGLGLQTGVAGFESLVEVQVRDRRQAEIQSIMASGTVIDFINDIQRLRILSSTGGEFQLTFRGEKTGVIQVGLSTLEYLEESLEALYSIGDVSVTSDGSSIIQAGDTIDVEFLTEHGNLDLMHSNGPEIIMKLQVGEAPYRAERQSLYCNADGGYVILGFNDMIVTIDFNDDMHTVESKISTIVGSAVSIVQVDESDSTICNSLGKQVFIDFHEVLGNVASISINFDALLNGAMTIYDGDEQHGAVNGISPMMGHFTLTHDGVTTVPIAVDASAADLKMALETLPSIGSISVTKDLIGIRQSINGENLAPGTTSLVNIWSVTFAPDNQDGCHPGSWEKCPSNIGDVTNLEVDTALVSFEIGATQQQSGPIIEVFEVRKGFTGNFIEDADGVEIDFSLLHNVVPGVGIGMAEIHELSCTYAENAISANNNSGSFELEILNKRITFKAQTSMSQLKNMLKQELNLVDPVSTVGSSYGTVCRFDSNNPVTAVTKLSFSKRESAFPEFRVHSDESLIVTARKSIYKINGLRYQGAGLFEISYTPKISGQYSASIKVNNEYLWTDLSSEVTVNPTNASAQYCSHNANLVAVAGAEQSFYLTARDRFGNPVSSASSETSVIVNLSGTPNPCNHIQKTDTPVVIITDAEVGRHDDHYKIFYTPSLAGQYQASVLLRSRGGLLATYHKDKDFSQPVYGNFIYNQSSYRWCKREYDCDSTLLDSEVSFSWGFESPLPSDPSFPRDSFSVIWNGEIKADVSDEYTFIIKLNGGARLTIGGKVIIDGLAGISAESVSSKALPLSKGVFYPIKVEYSHFEEESHVDLLWESSLIARQVVPSSALYFTRHIDGSPFTVQVLPGDIASSSVAQGDGLSKCVALQECAFTVYTKDENHNNRFNDGTGPRFEISMFGSGGWAKEGRINSLTTSIPVSVSQITVDSNDWDYIGHVGVTQHSNTISPNANMLGLLRRGDYVVIDGGIYTISSSGILDETSVPLRSPYLGPTKSSIPLYKTSKKCMTGTHTIKYTPQVRGTYIIDVKLPETKEVQRVSTFVFAGSSMSGTFTLQYGSLVSGIIEFDATAEELKSALQSIDEIGTVDVTVYECFNPIVSCSWDITFTSDLGDISLLLPTKDQLIGDGAEVMVEEITKGKPSTSITGFPHTIDVLPGETSPLLSTAYGTGLVKATAGKESSFIIQPKDSFGNDRLALQSSNLFAVHIYPEECDDHESYPSIEGNVTRNQSGAYTVKYTPFKSGFHTVAVVMSISAEKQMITTGYNTKARGGTFTIMLNKKPSLAIPWDANEEHLEAILDLSFGSTSSFSVEKQSRGLFNFKYLLSFKTALGDVPELVVDTSNLIGNAEDWDVTTLVDGKFSHIKISDQEREVQRITLKVVDALSIDGAAFSLIFMGRRTEPIPWDTDSGVLKTKLQKLATIGDIFVSSVVDASMGSRTWLITFDPYEGRSSNSIRNFGNLPLFEAFDVHESISVSIDPVQNGRSPFRSLVSPAEPATHLTTAFDYANVENFGGLSVGTYKSPTHFFLQAQDCYSNKVNDGPLSDVQIIETFSSSNIGGSFEVSILGEKLRFGASAFLSEVEKELQSIPGVGSVTVSSKSAKDKVVGKTAAVTKGLTTIVPSAELNEFIIGDWIRLGDQNYGQLFAIVAMSEVPPYTVDLSSPYLGESETAAAIFQHGSTHRRTGYQYIVSFDSILGDFPRLLVNGALLEGDEARVEVTSCDWNVSQNLRIDAMGPSIVSGHFYLNYRGDETRLLSVGATAGELMDAIISDISSIHSVSVVDEQHYAFGGKSWTIHLQAFDDEAELFFAEGHLLDGGSIVSTNYCPSASPTDPLYSVKSVAGRRGQEFVVSLHGPSTIHGTVDHDQDGRYLATYASPRAGEYLLSVLGADVGGLTGEYFDNCWLRGSPETTRVDNVLDFQWTSTDPVTPSGKDFVSIRWTGFIKPSFGEFYTFTVRVNDAVRLWIGNDLLIDEYESEVDDEHEFAEFYASTTNAFVANQLVDIKIEYRENRGAAMIRLFWESPSQPFAIIDSHRLFYNASHVLGSPFLVSPQPLEPSSPVNCSLSIASWDSLRINWSAPEDDGGVVVTKYLVESWDANEYGLTEKQQLRLRQTITGGTFAISLNGHEVIVPVDSTALEFERLLESLSNIGDAKVTKSLEMDFVVFDIEFLTDIAPVPVVSIDLSSATPVSEQGEYCICAKRNVQCHSGSPTLSCDEASSTEGSVSTQRTEISIGSKISADGIHFSHTINGLQQSSSIVDGFGVRVSAGNTKGFGLPCQPTFLKPAGPPLPPAHIEVERAASHPSSLALHFTSVSYPEDRASLVTGFFIEWSTTEGFLDGTVSSATLKADEVKSERLPSYNNVNKTFNFYLIQDLTPGEAYFVRIAAINQAGRGRSAHSTPRSLAPGSKPSDPENGVTLQTLIEVDSSVPVIQSCSSLYVSWRAPTRSNGFNVSKYLVEYWVSNGVSEVQEISIQSSKTTPIRGTFTLGYGKEKTNSLSIDASAEDIKNELESLSTIRSLKVWRSGENPTYRWTVTFLSEFPSVSGTILDIVDGHTQLMDSDGESPTLQVSVLTPASLPIGYSTEVIAVENPLKTHYSLTLTNLTPGQAYTVQVSAANSLGYGRPQPSVPRELSPPIEKPSSPTNIILRASSQSLEVIFSKPRSDGGDAVTLYKIEWDAKPEFNSNGGSPVGTHSFVSPKDEYGCDPCTYQIYGLTNGRDYFVRVYAYNSRGYSLDPGLPTPLFLSPKRSPDPPDKVVVSAYSGTEIEVAFPPSGNNGGAPVTKYMVKWNAMGYLTGMALANGDKQSLLYSAHNVQTITLTADGDDIEGSFRVAYENHATEEISVNSSANDMKLALESLPTIGSTVVSRKTLTDGLIWAVTFLSNVGDKDEFGPIPALTVSIDSADLPEMFVADTLGLSGTTLQGSGSRLVVNEVLTAFKGFEQQIVTAQCASPQGILGGHFSLSFDGIRTNDLKFDVSASGLKEELEK